MNDKRILTDLYDVLTSQQTIITYLLNSHMALVNTLANDSALPTFSDHFEDDYTQRSQHPKGEMFEALSAMRRKLVAIGETLKRDMGSWNN
jgi:hypothetical protein